MPLQTINISVHCLIHKTKNTVWNTNKKRFFFCLKNEYQSLDTNWLRYVLLIPLFFRHFSQLQIMFVGGPNTRKDYHIEEGEEVNGFYLKCAIWSFEWVVSEKLLCNADHFMSWITLKSSFFWFVSSLMLTWPLKFTETENLISNGNDMEMVQSSTKFL